MKQTEKEIIPEVPAKVLVIDDEEAIVTTIATLLRSEGYEVTPATSGEEGLKLFEQSHFDLVLTDLRLGDISGTDVLRRVKQIRPKTAVIILTGYATTESAIDAVRLGAADYLTKPVRISELAMAVRNQITTAQLNEQIENLNKAVTAERDKLRSSVAELTLLKRLADRMMSALSYIEGFEVILNFLVDEIKSDVAAIYDFERHEARLSSYSHPNKHELEQLANIINTEGTKLSGKNRYQQFERIEKLNIPSVANHSSKLCSSIAIPLMQEKSAFGLLVASSRTNKNFKSEWSEFVEQIARSASEFLSRVKRSVERQQNMTAAIVEHSVDGIAVINMKSAEVLLNPSARSLLELPIGTRPTIEHIEKHLNCNLKEFWDELNSEGDDAVRKRTIVKHADILWNNQQMFLKLMISYMPDASGVNDGSMMVSMRDVTQERSIEAMKEKLIANISHELRTPTAVIKEFISLILDGVSGELNPDQKRLLGIMQSNIERLSRLIENLMSLARADTGGLSIVLRPEPVYPIIQMVTDSLQPKMQHKKIKLNVDLPPDIPLIYADREAVTQIFTNLLENARKYSPNNTEIRVTAEVKGARVVFGIADEGYGIPAAERENIFNRFYRLVDKEDPRFEEGVGLGLPLVKDLVIRHGGDIWVVSEEGKGSVFYFSLQTATEDEAEKLA